MQGMSVIAKYPFGVFVGVGFPGLLEIVFIEDMTPELFRSGNWCPLGSSLTAFLRWPEIESDDRQITLWQVDPHQLFTVER